MKETVERTMMWMSEREMKSAIPSIKHAEDSA